MFLCSSYAIKHAYLMKVFLREIVFNGGVNFFVYVTNFAHIIFCWHHIQVSILTVAVDKLKFLNAKAKHLLIKLKLKYSFITVCIYVCVINNDLQMHCIVVHC